MQTEPRDMYFARVAAMDAGIPVETPALTLNRLCGSGLQAIVSAAQSIRLGDCDIAVAGGAESMSRAPYLAPSFRWGTKMGEHRWSTCWMTRCTIRSIGVPMGVTAENVAEQHGISREEQDALALESHKRAAPPSARPFQGAGPRGRNQRPQGRRRCSTPTSMCATTRRTDDFAKLRPVFKQDGGSVTAGNASGINDGAAAVVLASEVAVGRLGLTPLGAPRRLCSRRRRAALMGIGPMPATRLALEEGRARIGDIDVIESNEAFAAQACAVARELGFDPAKVNPNGSGISLGHPVGATGAIITVKALYELAAPAGVTRW